MNLGVTPLPTAGSTNASDSSLPLKNIPRTINDMISLLLVGIGPRSRGQRKSKEYQMAELQRQIKEVVSSLVVSSFLLQVTWKGNQMCFSRNMVEATLKKCRGCENFLSSQHLH